VTLIELLMLVHACVSGVRPATRHHHHHHRHHRQVTCYEYTPSAVSRSHRGTTSYQYERLTTGFVRRS